MRNRAMAEALKLSQAYIAAREAALARFAVETPDCYYRECSDCCYIERSESGVPWSFKCPECDGQMLIGEIRGGAVK